jgi:hypothetical protein
MNTKLKIEKEIEGLRSHLCSDKLYYYMMGENPDTPDRVKNRKYIEEKINRLEYKLIQEKIKESAKDTYNCQ